MMCIIHMVPFLLWKVIDDMSYDGLQYSYGSVFVVEGDR